MAYDQFGEPVRLNVQQVDAVNPQGGTLEVMLSVVFASGTRSEGQVQMVFDAELAEDLSARLQALVPHAKRQSRKRT